MRILLWIVLSAVVVVVIVIGAIAWYGRNTARSQTEFITEFSATLEATVYCGNGSGRDIWGVQDTPWWEWILLSDGTVEDFSSKLASELNSRGFDVAVTSGDPSEYLLQAESLEAEVANLRAKGYATEWTNIRGATSQGLVVEGRIASEMTPRNNCFPKFDDVITPAEPSDFDVVAVMKFRDQAFGDD
jgi:hypothetical protein